MKTKYVCRGLINQYVNFHNNRTTKLHVKICRWGGGEGEMKKSQNYFIHIIFEAHETKIKKIQNRLQIRL